jgi:hypothetical protein
MLIDRVISTAGGIAWSKVDEQLMLFRLQGTFVAGETPDGEAPTGGHLLQASIARRGRGAGTRRLGCRTLADGRHFGFEFTRIRTSAGDYDNQATAYR